MADLYNTLVNFIPASAALIIVFICAVIVGLETGKWRKLYFTRREYLATVVVCLIGIVAFFQIPLNEMQGIYRIVIVCVLAVFVLLSLARKEHCLFPKNLLLKKWDRIYQYKDKESGKFFYRIVKVFLSPYEKAVVEIKELRRIYNKKPYEVYARLNALEIPESNIKLKQDQQHLRAAVLIEMGAYTEAKSILENMVQNGESNLKTLTELCVAYDRTGNSKEAMRIAEGAYQEVIAGRNQMDQTVLAEVYHNYASCLEKKMDTHRGLDIAKKAVDIALEQENLLTIQMTILDYFKLVWKYERDIQRIEEYLEKYRNAIPGDCDLCLEYVNVKLQLFWMGCQIGNLSQYLLEIYHKNLLYLSHIEEKCFFCMSCMKVAFGQGLDISDYLSDMVYFLKYHTEELNCMERLRIYSGLAWIVNNYQMHCAKNRYQISEDYNILQRMYFIYVNNKKSQEIKKMLDQTDSIWLRQRCELREMQWQVLTVKEYNFEKFYEIWMQLYNDWQSVDAIWEMLEVDLHIIEECMSKENVEDSNTEAFLMRTAKKEVIRKHLADAERLLNIMDYDAVRVDYAIRMSKGYFFAGMLEDAKRQLQIFESKNISETFLLQWHAEDYQNLKRFIYTSSRTVG